jgi:hypothetical protein
MSANPFHEIDQSAHKIHQLIDAFQISDQEFLMELPTMLSDDSGVDNMDHQTILMQERFSLAEMIQEHVDSADTQVKLLGSLKYWFNDLQRQSQDQIDHEIPALGDTETVDVVKLASLINDCCQRSESRTEKMAALHSGITAELTRRVRETEVQVNVGMLK